MEITVQDVIQFCLAHKKGKVFKGFSDDQVANSIRAAVMRHGIIVDVDEKTGICGMATGELLFDYKLVHVNHILCIKAGSLKRIFQRFLELFPGWDIQAERHGNLIRYKDIGKLAKKILSYG